MLMSSYESSQWWILKMYASDFMPQFFERFDNIRLIIFSRPLKVQRVNVSVCSSWQIWLPCIAPYWHINFGSFKDFLMSYKVKQILTLKKLWYLGVKNILVPSFISYFSVLALVSIYYNHQHITTETAVYFLLFKPGYQFCLSPCTVQLH